MNYTDEMTEYLSTYYTEAVNKDEAIEHLMEYFSKSKKSVVAKLTSLGIYQRKTYLSKIGTPPITKKELIVNLSTLVNGDPDKMQSFIKVSKQELIYLIDLLNQQKPENFLK